LVTRGTSRLSGVLSWRAFRKRFCRGEPSGANKKDRSHAFPHDIRFPFNNLHIAPPSRDLAPCYPSCEVPIMPATATAPIDGAAVHRANTLLAPQPYPTPQRGPARPSPKPPGLLELHKNEEVPRGARRSWLRFFKRPSGALRPTHDAPKPVPPHRICALRNALPSGSSSLSTGARHKYGKHAGMHEKLSRDGKGA
jgi:hypothetical protein